MPKRNPVRSEGKMIHVRLSEATRKKLRLRVVKEDSTIQDWVSGLIASALKSSSISNTQEGKK